MTTLQEKLAADIAEGVHTLHIMDGTGDTRLTWDPANEFEVSEARKAFDSHKSKGYLAYKVQGDGSQGEVIRDFDPENRAMIMTPQHVGG